MVVPNVSSRNPPVPPKLPDLVAPPSILSSYYVLLMVKILLVLIILFSLPKLVTSETAMTMLSTTKERRNNGNGNSVHRSRNQHHIYKRYKYKLRSLRDDCQNNMNKPCASLIPEESLNCVNECMSSACYQQVYDSTREIIMEHHEDGTTTRTVVIREPLEDGEIDVDRAKEFDQCVMNELRQLQPQPKPQQQQ